MKFKKKPVVIEAYQLPELGDWDLEEFFVWAEANDFHNYFSDRDEGIAIETLEGSMRADPGDWIIKGVAGEFYPCKPEIFEATYEAVEQCKHLRTDTNFLQNTNTCMDCGATL